MGGLTSAVHWWEESQMRVLVLISLAIQILLFIFCFLRRAAIPGWFRSIMWLAYLGSDAVAIYALATLFNRHKAGEDGGGGGGSGSSNSMIEVVWAPVLLIHLGGHDGITAYNIEDNELWSRHFLTAVSQVTVAIYVFCKSWPPGGDKRLLQAGIMLFIPGVVKCFVKPLVLKMASIYSLVSSHAAKPNESEMYALEEYVKRAKDFVEFAQEQNDEGEVHGTYWSTTVVEDGNHHQRHEEDNGTIRREERTRNDLEREERRRKRHEEQGDLYKLFVDIPSSYPRRLSTIKHLWRLSEESTYGSIREGLSRAFLRLYTSLRTSGFLFEHAFYRLKKFSDRFKVRCNALMLLSRMSLPWASIGLFHHSHREAYNDIDVKITYALFCYTAVLEGYSMFPLLSVLLDDMDLNLPRVSLFGELWPEMVTQYNLIQFFARNKTHKKKMWIARKLGCKDFLDLRWHMKFCFSSAGITKLVLRYLKDGWKEKIRDAASYLSFNEHSSHWVLEHNHCNSQVAGMMSIKRPFDESVLLWHMTTDFCFFLSSFSQHKYAFAEGPIQRWMREQRMEAQSARGGGTSSQCSQESTECKAVQCRQMSNYMVYLLFVNPEMLLPGTRRNLFTAAYNDLKDILLLEDNKKPSLFATAYKEVKDILLPEGNRQNGYRRVTAAFKKMKDILRDNNRNPLSCSQWKQAAPVKEEFLMEKLISTMLDKPKQASEEELQEGRTEEQKGGYKENFINDAWILAQRLMDKGDEEEMWEEIEGIWVEMLCFSASRCRGYLHAKALGNGGEFLSYIWLLLFYMGMETFTDKLQRLQLQSWGGNNGTAPAPPSASEVSVDPSPSSTTKVSTSTTLSSLQIHIDVAPSTSEIRMAAQDMN